MKSLNTETRAGLAVAGAAAAVGLVAGLAARAGARGIAKAAEPLAGDWLDVIKTEHLMLLELFDKLEATKGDAAAKRNALLEKIRAALARHALEEENVLYAALRLSGEADAAARLNTEHAEAKAELYELDLMPADDPAWRSKVRALRERLEAHMQREEDEIFPALRQTLSPEDDDLLTTQVMKEGRRVGP